MSKAFWTLLILGILCCGAALAQSPAPASHPAAPDLQTLHQAIFAPNADPQPKALLCSPQSIDPCVNKSCQCSRFTCAACGVKSFTCDEATGASTCVCKTC
ncbi:MAG TPA: hypothetical protein VLR69_06410 [Thermoanaerobaculia bacterium]|nr:hypothetical protein [Thermoanaerobaculia bacterium]